MTTIGIGSDYVADNSAVTNQATGNGYNAFDYLAMVSSVAGPTTAASLYAGGNEAGAAIAAATGNATYSGALTMSNTGSGSYLTTGGLGTTSSYYTGGGSYATTGTSGVSGSVEDILADSATSQAYLIGIQAQLQNQNMVYTGTSNCLSSRQNMERSILQNLKG